MLSLQLLGSFNVSTDSGPVSGRAVQRHRVAILALLACSPSRTLSRDKLIAYVWPDSSTDTARHRLSVALHELRRALGEDVIFSIGDGVGLNTTLASVDVVEFERALAEGDWQRADALYRGPLLDGFFLDGSAEFERWLEAERERCARAQMEALEWVALDRRRAGDFAGEVEAWRKLVARDPYSSRLAAELMRALASAGDRGAALQHARLHADVLKREFESEPDAELAALMEDLRRATARPTNGIEQEEVGEPAGSPTPRGRRRAFILVVLTMVVAAGSWTMWLKRATPATATTRIAVLPFAVHGDESFDYLREGIVDLLSTSLDGAGDIRTLDPHALLEAIGEEQAVPAQARLAQKQLRATGYITGNVHASGETLRIHASLYDAGGRRPIAVASVDGQQADLFKLIDALSAELIAGASRRPRDRSIRIAAMTTHSLPALKAYLNGERDYRAGRFVAATDAFTRAIELDSTFALAHYRLALSMLWANVPDTLPFEPEERALRHSANLTAHDQKLLRAFIAWRIGHAEDAERIYREILSMYPDDAEAWHQLGETLFHYNPLRGSPAAEADVAFERAAALDPKSWSALWHRVLIAAAVEDWGRFDRLAAQLDALGPEPPQALELLALRAFVRRDHAAQTRLEPQLQRASQLQLFEMAWRAATLGGSMETAERLVEIVADSARGDRVLAAVAHTSLALARADRSKVQARLNQLARLDDDQMHVDYYRALAVLQPLAPARREDMERVLAEMLKPHPAVLVQFEKLHAAGLLSAELGHTELLMTMIERLEELSADSADARKHGGSLAGLRARLARLNGSPGEALKLIESARNQMWFGWAVASPYWSGVADRYLHAELLREAGRFDEALGWYEGLEEFSIYDLSYLGPSHYRRAEIYEQLGKQRLAAHHYQQFVTLWSSAVSNAFVDSARVRLRRL